MPTDDSPKSTAEVRGGGYKANFLSSVIFLIFQYYENTR